MKTPEVKENKCCQNCSSFQGCLGYLFGEKPCPCHLPEPIEEKKCNRWCLGVNCEYCKVHTPSSNSKVEESWEIEFDKKWDEYWPLQDSKGIRLSIELRGSIKEFIFYRESQARQEEREKVTLELNKSWLEDQERWRDKIFQQGQQEERQFILNILDGVDIADEQMENPTGGTKAIRHALKNRIIE